MRPLHLPGAKIAVGIDSDLCVTVVDRNGRLLWETARSHAPSAVVCTANGQPCEFPLAAASHVSTSPFHDGEHKGCAIRLSGLGRSDATVELTLALGAADDELMIQAAQVDGADTVVSVCHLYRFEKAAADGGYMVLPHGSGYLIRADCADPLPGDNPHENRLVGARWSMPVFGMVRGNDSLCAIVETWWDCEASAEHVPGDKSVLDFDWVASLGSLSYPRRLLLRFAKGMDYVAMAKAYREYARAHGLLARLEDKAVKTPVIQEYVNNVLVRWTVWNPDERKAVLRDIRRLHKEGFEISFFFPKWYSGGYSPEHATQGAAVGLWQGYLHPVPVAGGWDSLVTLAQDAQNLGCLVQGFIGMRRQNPAAPCYDEANIPVSSTGEPDPGESVRGVRISQYGAPERLAQCLDNIEARGLKLDILYFDGYSAHTSAPEDFRPIHQMSRRQIYEAQKACFAETRNRGIMPGGELARFWCMADCDYFFYTDWSADRLTNVPTQGAPAPVGQPIPLFQLVFNDCFIAGFSGGGYKLYVPGFDWWAGRTPRLYELLFGAAPCYNWLPDGVVPIEGWESSAVKSRLVWLTRWGAFYRAIAMKEMLAHSFPSGDYTKHRVEFATGIGLHLDMATNRFRVEGVEGFSGQWEKPEEL